jgi:hypothetical protein
VSLERTELEWTYQPADFFEAPLEWHDGEYDLVLKDGRALATLHVPSDPLPEGLDRRIGGRVAAFLAMRRVLAHRPCEFGTLKVNQVAGKKRKTAGRAAAAVPAHRAGRKSGNGAGNGALDEGDALRDARMLRDKEAERIAEDTALLVSLAPKLAESSTLCKLVVSYSAAVTDPDRELIHLYKVRDDLAGFYGTEETARTTLRIDAGEWNRFARLVNSEPVQQGRHHVKHPDGLRAARPEELADARDIVRRWIIEFAKRA